MLRNVVKVVDIVRFTWKRTNDLFGFKTIKRKAVTENAKYVPPNDGDFSTRHGEYVGSRTGVEMKAGMVTREREPKKRTIKTIDDRHWKQKLKFPHLSPSVRDFPFGRANNYLCTSNEV